VKIFVCEYIQGVFINNYMTFAILMHNICPQQPEIGHMSVTFVLSQHIYNNFNSSIFDPNVETHL